MALFKKSLPTNIDAEECEHILGILLTDRKRFINFSGIAQENIYAGIVIGQAFNTSIEKLDDEFDALSIYFVWKVLNSIGVNEGTFMRGASAVFDNFEISDEMRKLYSRRIEDYSDVDNSEIGVKLLSNIARIYSGTVEKNDPKILANQLKLFHKSLEKNILNELSA